MFKTLSLIAGFTISSSLLASGEHKHDFPKPIEKFHSIMAPLFHAEAGVERMKNTCDNVETMSQLAQEIQSEHIDELNNAIIGVAESCNAEIQDFDKALDNLHNAFHKVAKK